MIWNDKTINERGEYTGANVLSTEEAKYIMNYKRRKKIEHITVEQLQILLKEYREIHERLIKLEKRIEDHKQDEFAHKI